MYTTVISDCSSIWAIELSSPPPLWRSTEQWAEGYSFHLLWSTGSHSCCGDTTLSPILLWWGLPVDLAYEQSYLPAAHYRRRKGGIWGKLAKWSYYYIRQTLKELKSRKSGLKPWTTSSVAFMKPAASCHRRTVYCSMLCRYAIASTLLFCT